MLTHPTLDRLQELGLHGMARAFAELHGNADAADLAFEDRLGLMLDREADLRATKRYQTRLRQAKLRLQAAIEDVDFRTPRGLDKTLLLSLADCRWVTAGHNLLIVGPTGSGKTWLACALGHKACRENLAVLYVRLPRLAEELALARADGRYPKLMATLGRLELLILDDWGLTPRRAPRSAGDRRRPPRSHRHLDHQPVPSRPLARSHRRADPGRRYPRPPHPQRPSHRARGRIHAQATPRERHRLTEKPASCNQQVILRR